MRRSDGKIWDLPVGPGDRVEDTDFSDRSYVEGCPPKMTSSQHQCDRRSPSYGGEVLHTRITYLAGHGSYLCGTLVAATDLHPVADDKPMNPERWQRIEGLFNSALARAESERAAFLRGLCPR